MEQSAVTAMCTNFALVCAPDDPDYDGPRFAFRFDCGPAGSVWLGFNEQNAHTVLRQLCAALLQAPPPVDELCAGPCTEEDCEEEDVQQLPGESVLLISAAVPLQMAVAAACSGALQSRDVILLTVQLLSDCTTQTFALLPEDALQMFDWLSPELGEEAPWRPRAYHAPANPN